MEKVKIDVAVVGAQQAAQQTKTLKQQIKDLRTELEGLTQGTDEYNAKLTELGNAMHQQQEITEQAKMATEDYGATLGNLSGVASGVVGSIAAVSGVMNMLGVSNKGAEETVKTMTSLIGILQGLSALDSAEKNFQKLWQKMKNFGTATKQSTEETKKNTTSMEANSVAAKEDAASMGQATVATKAQGVAANTTTKATNLLSLGFKNLGRAITSFMASNPFTLIILLATTLISIISNLIDKTEEENEKLKEMQKNARDAIDEANRQYNGGTAITQEAKIAYGKNEYRKSPVLNSDGSKYSLSPEEDGRTERQNLKSDIEYLRAELEKLEKQEKKFTQEYETQYSEYLNKERQLIYGQITWWERRKAAAEAALAADEEDADAKAKQAEALSKLNNLYVDYYNIIKAGDDYVEDYKKHDANKLKDDAAKWKQLQADELSKLKNKYDLQRKLAENEYKRGEKSGEEYYKKLREIENEYYEEYKKWATRFNVSQQDRQIAEANHKAAILAINKSLNDELRKLMEERMRILQNSKDPTNDIERQDAEKGQERALELAQRTKDDNERVMMAEEETRRQRLDFDAGWFYTKLRMLEQYNRDAARLEHEGEIERMRIQEERQENDKLFIQSEYDRNRDNIERQQRFEMEMLRAKFDEELALQRQYAEDNNLGEEYIQKKKLELEQEYGEKYVELEHEYKLKLMELETDYINDIAQAEADLADTRLNIQREEFAMEQELFEQKKAMVKNYISAFSSITSAVSSLLSEVQSQYKEGTKQYEQIAETMLIMQTIEGSLAAFVSGVESGLPAPYNFILGGVLAALATATGVMAIQNLKSKKLSSSALSAPTVNPYETLSYETNSNIEGNIQDSRCYVLESDITSTQNRVSVAEEEASF